MIERTGVGRSREGGSLLGRAALLVSCSLLLIGSGCGSRSTDTTARSQPDQGDEASDDDANERGDDAAGSDGTDPAEGSAGAGSTGTSSMPDYESIASLCDAMCEAWSDCEEAGGAECLDECNGFTASSAEIGCYPLVQALYACVLAANECPEDARCDTEADALGRCTNGADDSNGGLVANPSPMAGGSGNASSGSASGGSASSGPDSSAPAPSNPSNPPPIEGEDRVDPAEHFGGEDSTPEAILEASDLPQCSEFEVDEFECGSSGYSSGGALCTADCYDPDDRVWSSLCRDGICRCQYDGITYCQCAHEGMTENGCNSCCPQLTDADFEF